jgi:glycosyltransferase involved in cell wall biosynthesis
LKPLPIAKFVLEDEIDPRVIAEVGYLRGTSVGNVALAIRQLVLHSGTFLENITAPPGARISGMDAELQVYRSTIVYTSWERTTVHPGLVEVLNRCAEVWVPCHQNRDAFGRAGVSRVRVMPCPYDPITNLACHVAAPWGSEDVPVGKRFYAIGKWEPRKNYHALVGAFLQEFSPTERASLFVKTHEWGGWEGYPRVNECIEQWLATPEVQAKGWTRQNCDQHVRLITRRLSEEKLVQLHRDNNIYVTCSHGEAWDLPAFDARCAGNRLVFTGFGGAEDYAGREDVAIWEGDPVLEPVHPGYGWEADGQWASCPVEKIRAALRAAQPPKRRMHPPDLYERFGFPAVGARMEQRIKVLFPQAYEELKLVGGFG